MNGIATITLNGQAVRLKFGLPAVRRIMEKMVQYKLADDGIYSDLGLSHVLYAGYMNDCIMRDDAPAIAFEVFYDHVENLRDDEAAKIQVQEAVKAFEASRFVKAAAELVKPDEKKSSLNGTTSKHSSMEN